jgi:hypothetical protein
VPCTRRRYANAGLKKVHLTSPLALTGRKRINEDTKEWGAGKWPKKEKGKAKGKGKGNDKGSKGAKSSKQQLVGNTAAEPRTTVA